MGCFHFLTVRNHAAVNIPVTGVCVDVFFVSPGCMPGTETAGSCHFSVSRFKHLPNYLPKVLPHFTVLPARKGSRFSTSVPALVVACLFHVVILVGMKGCLMALAFVFPMTNVVEPLTG